MSIRESSVALDIYSPVCHNYRRRKPNRNYRRKNRMRFGKIISVLAGTLTALSVLAPLGSGAYSDVGTARFYSRAVAFCTERRYMAGTSENEFSPDKPITRAELAVVLNSLDNSPDYEGDDPDMDFDAPFPDVERGQWYTDAVVWGKSTGFFSGYPDGTFGVNANVSRAQLVTVLRAFADYKGYETEISSYLGDFADSYYTPKWSLPGFRWAYATGLIAGSSDRYGRLYLNPLKYVTRGETAVMIKALCDNITAAEQKALLNGKYLLMGGGGDGSNDSELVHDEMIALTGKENPNFLYVGYAMDDPMGDYSWARGLFGDGYGCSVDILTNDDAANPEAAREKVEKADIVYVGGGDTRKLVATLKRSGIDAMLRSAAKRGAVMAGTSAGAICFCESGESSVYGGFMRVDGIGCVNLLYCPHALTDNGRFDKIPAEVESTPYMKCAAFDGATLEIANGQYRAIVTARGNMTELCSWENGEFRTVTVTDEWRPVSELLG